MRAAIEDIEIDNMPPCGAVDVRARFHQHDVVAE